MSENLRRNKDAALLPPPYFYGSGDIPTDPSSPYHNNLPGESPIPAPSVPVTGVPAGNVAGCPGIGGSYTAAGMLVPTSILPADNDYSQPRFYADGSMGTLTILWLNKTIKVYHGESLENMKKGIGHFEGTSAWDGNVCLAGHNRGAAAYFGFVKDLAIGDRLTYTTPYGTRTYEVYRKEMIGETDYSALSNSQENRLSLITCVENQASLRWLIQAREVVQG
jgi:sortase A